MPGGCGRGQAELLWGAPGLFVEQPGGCVAGVWSAGGFTQSVMGSLGP